MIKLTNKNGEVFDCANFLKAHQELVNSRDCGPECSAARLIHYSNFEHKHDDFGNEIGRECVEAEGWEVLNQGEVK